MCADDAGGDASDAPSVQRRHIFVLEERGGGDSVRGRYEPRPPRSGL